MALRLADGLLMLGTVSRMEKTPLHRTLEEAVAASPAETQTPAIVEITDWLQVLPTLTGALVTLPELQPFDAPSALASVAHEEVSRFILPPPATTDGFERFIAWAQRERSAGRYELCDRSARSRRRGRSFSCDRSSRFWRLRMGFALAPSLGTGIYTEAAELIIDFAFETIGSHRLERVPRFNALATARRKLGAIHEGILRRLS